MIVVFVIPNWSKKFGISEIVIYVKSLASFIIKRKWIEDIQFTICWLICCRINRMPKINTLLFICTLTVIVQIFLVLINLARKNISIFWSGFGLDLLPGPLLSVHFKLLRRRWNSSLKVPREINDYCDWKIFLKMDTMTQQ